MPKKRRRCSLWTCIMTLAGLAAALIVAGSNSLQVVEQPSTEMHASRRTLESCPSEAINASSKPEPKPWKSVSSGSLPLQLTPESIPLFIRWEQWLPRRRLYNASFVQIGGNCGKNNKECAQGGDPIWEYATRLAWSGAVLEPGTKAYAKLCKNYRHYPKVRLLNALVSDHDGEVFLSGKGESAREHKFRPVDPQLNASWTAQFSKAFWEMLGYESQKNESQKKQRKKNKKALERTHAITLQTLWTYLGPPKSVDILVLDVEGNEPKILRGKLPRPLPTFILFESVHLKDKDKKAIGNNLQAYGYEKQAELEHLDETAIGMGLGPQDTLYKLQKRKTAKAAGRQNATSGTGKLNATSGAGTRNATSGTGTSKG